MMTNNPAIYVCRPGMPHDVTELYPIDQSPNEGDDHPER